MLCKSVNCVTLPSACTRVWDFLALRALDWHQSSLMHNNLVSGALCNRQSSHPWCKQNKHYLRLLCLQLTVERWDFASIQKLSNPNMQQAVDLFRPNHLLGHPDFFLFSLSKNIFSGSNDPKTILFDFENRSTATNLWMNPELLRLPNDDAGSRLLTEMKQDRQHSVPKWSSLSRDVYCQVLLGVADVHVDAVVL